MEVKATELHRINGLILPYGDRLYTLESYVYRRQPSKDGPRTERIKIL